MEIINIGITADDGTGDPIRTAFDKCNSNFQEVLEIGAGLDPGTLAVEFDEMIAIQSKLSAYKFVPGDYATLELARTDGGAIGKTVIVASVLSEAQSNITAAWPADRALRVEKGGSIGNSTTFTINGPFEAGNYQVFAGVGIVAFAGGAIKEARPEWFGAARDATTDDTAAFQKAINSIQTGGGMLSLSDGTYILTAVDIYSNLTIVGQSWNTKCKHKVGFNSRFTTGDATYPYEVDGMFTANAFGGGTANTDDNITNVRFHNMTLEGNSVEDGFLETLNLIALTAVSNVVIENCRFLSPRGDAIDMVTNSVLLGNKERHSKNIHIFNCVFDGVNYSNRQAISIYDVDGAVIENNYFTRFTHASMPGAIDLEPAGSVNPILRNITIQKNRFYKIGATNDKPAIAVSLSLLDQPDRTKFGNILVKDNGFDFCSGILAIMENSANISLNERMMHSVMVVDSNKFTNIYRPILTYGFWGVDFTNNVIINANESSLMGNPSATGNWKINNNIFEKMARTDGISFLIYSLENIEIAGNTFLDCGADSGTLGNILSSQGGAITRLNVHDNTIKDTTSVMKNVFYDAAGTFAASTTVYAKNNTIEGATILNYTDTSDIVVAGKYTAAPNATDVTLFALKPGRYEINTTGFGGDMANFGAYATVLVGTSSAKIIASNTAFVTLSVSGLNLQAKQSSGSANDINYTYRYTGSL